MSVLIIAEAGVNHNGDESLAMQLVDAAAESGAYVVKFQTFQSRCVVAASAPKAAYQQAKMRGAYPQQALMDAADIKDNRGKIF